VNNVIVAGYSRAANYDIYTAKHAAATGSLIWGRRVDGGSSDAAWDMAVDRKGDVFVTGTAYRSAGVRDGVTYKYSGRNGDLLWSKKPNGGAGTAAPDDENFGIGLDGLGNVLVGGYTMVNGNRDIYFSKKRNGSGDIVGEREFDGIYTRTDDLIRQLQVDQKGNIWMVGYTTSITGQREVLVLRMFPSP